jgi:23S rRNA pseudouridine2604 synthase
MQPERLSKIMAQRGLCSRREADRYIERGLVFVDGVRITELGTKISPDADVKLSREGLARQQTQVTILLNKPVGYVSGQAEEGYKPAATLIGAHTRWK